MQYATAVETVALDLLAAFVAVAETTSFSLAAKRLSLTKSTVSRQVARLEQSLGTQLFHRTSHHVRLTAAGTALLERVAPQLASLREAVGAMRDEQPTPRGELRLTAPNDFGAAWLSETVSAFVARYPEVTVTVKLTMSPVDLLADGYDLALRISAGLPDSSLVARKLATVEMHLYASPAYVSQRGYPQTLDDLGQHDWVTLTGMTTLLGLPVPLQRQRIRADDFLVVREAVRNGSGLAVLPRFLTARDLAAGTLVRVLPSWAEARGNLYAVYPRARHVPTTLRAFRDFLLDHLKLRPLAP
jgi:DNA-binding transcriptional LysR family regulator